MPGERLEVGRIGRAHGLNGEVAVSFTSNRPERYVPGARLYDDDRELVIESSRAHQGRRLIRFVGVEDRDTAEHLRGHVLYAEPLVDDVALADDEYWVHELIGSAVHDRAGARLGTVVAVEANPAHDLLVLDTGALVPMVFVTDQRAGVVVVDPPSGLLDL